MGNEKHGAASSRSLPRFVRLVGRLERPEAIISRAACDKDRREAAAAIRSLTDWIKREGEITDTCTYDILREVCNGCRCHRMPNVEPRHPAKNYENTNDSSE